MEKKITTKVLREEVNSFNSTYSKVLKGKQIRFVRTLDESIGVDIISSDNSIKVLDDSGMTNREALYFVRGMEALIIDQGFVPEEKKVLVVDEKAYDEVCEEIKVEIEEKEEGTV